MKGLLVALVVVLAGSGQAQQNPAAQFPAGEWSFTHRPYLRPGADAMPVRVMAVTGEATRLQITAQKIRNQSGKTVSELRLSWYLTRENEPNRILATGVTPAVFPISVPTGETLSTVIPVMAFADVYRPFVIDGKLSGRFAVEVAVTEARYGDGSSWKAEALPAVIRVSDLHVK